MPIHSLKKLLGHQHLNTTQIYARIYDDTLCKQFRGAMSKLESVEIDESSFVRRRTEEQEVLNDVYR
jgi:hypothetical protein